MAGESYPVEILDTNGIERLGGTLVFTDANDQPVPSTGLGMEFSDGAGNVTIAPGAIGSLTWAAVGGDTLLDYTDTALPTFILAGTYIVAAQARAETALAVGDTFTATLNVGGAASLTATCPPSVAVETRPSVSLTLCAVVAAGDPLSLLVESACVGSEDFGLNTTTICKIA